MKKLFKKSLACLLAAILCVSLFVAAVPASAEALNYSTNNVVAKAGETVEIDFTVANFSNVIGAMIKFYLPEAIASVDAVLVNDAEIAEYDDETGAGYYQVGTADGVQYIKFMSLFGEQFDELASVDGLTFNITATVAEDAAEGAYNYAAPVFSITEDGETLADVTGAFGTFEVKNGPTVDDKIVTTGMIVVSDTIGISYVITGVDAYEDFDLVVTKNAYSTVDYNVTTSEVVVNKANMTYYKGAYYATVYGFALTDLCLGVESVITAGDVVSAGYDTTVKALAEELYASTTAVDTKTVLTDLLNMGAEAMAYFAGRFPSSALAAVAEEAYPNYGFDQTYATAEVPELTLGAGQTSNTGATISAMGTILQSPAFAYVIKPDATAADLNVEISFYDAYKKEEVKSTATAADMQLYKGSYYYNFSTLPLYASNAVAEITVKDGDTVLGTHTYTVEQFASENITSETMGAILTSIAKFGASARAYFKIA